MRLVLLAALALAAPAQAQDSASDGFAEACVSYLELARTEAWMPVQRPRQRRRTCNCMYGALFSGGNDMDAVTALMGRAVALGTRTSPAYSEAGRYAQAGVEACTR